MNTTVDPTIRRFVRLTAYFLWSLLEQPEQTVMGALRGHPRYRNTRFLRDFSDVDFKTLNQGCADSFADVLLLPNNERNLANTVRILREHVIASARTIGRHEKVRELEQGDPLINARMQVYGNSVHKSFIRFEPWITKVMMLLPNVLGPQGLNTEMSDHALMSENFWPAARAVTKALPQLQAFIIKEYHGFLRQAIETYLSLMIINEPEIVSEDEVGPIVAQLYVKGLTDLINRLK
jgi:hypothetical protein